MKRFVFAGLVVALGLLILGAATATLMSGPDKPKQAQHSAPTEPKHQGGGMGSQQAQPIINPPQPPKPVQPAAIAGPGVLQPLTTIQPPQVRPPAPDSSPHVPVIQQTDEQGSRGK